MGVLEPDGGAAMAGALPATTDYADADNKSAAAALRARLMGGGSQPAKAGSSQSPSAKRRQASTAIL